MDELQQLYTFWSNRQSDSAEIKHAWSAIDQYLCAHCPKDTIETIENLIMDFSKLTEQQSYYAGYREGFQIWLETLCHFSFDSKK